MKKPPKTTPQNLPKPKGFSASHEFDSDGYPTEKTLKTLRRWPFPGDAGAALDFMASAWWCPSFGVSRKLSKAEREIVHAEPGDRYLRLATGGWSGNESLIDAFRQNLHHMMTWKLNARGGLHIFKYPDKTPAKAPAVSQEPPPHPQPPRKATPRRKAQKGRK